MTPVASGGQSCDDGDMGISPVAGNGCPVATEAGCIAVELFEPGPWMSPNAGTASCVNDCWSGGHVIPASLARLANSCAEASSMPLGSSVIVGTLCCHIGLALRSFKRRPLKLASVRRDKPRHGCEIYLAWGSISSCVNTPVGIVAGSASRGGVAHIGVTSGHVSPHLIAGDGRQTRRRVILVTGTPMGSIIPQLGGGGDTSFRTPTWFRELSQVPRLLMWHGGGLQYVQRVGIQR
jgi:hypothetical protein